ncbi:MAG: threonine synthase [Anaerolineae bacterium]|jgi:threonine synthase|nr:threonine synthase [Anaerolineae bacterium]MDH7473231.1 threonine synthase [Anaerolineae bacterium]
MDHVLGLKCVLCGAEYGVDEVLYVCPKHGDEGILDVVYDYPRIRPRLTRERLAADPTPSIWRYLPLLPVDPSTLDKLRHDGLPTHPLFCVGWTPLYRARNLERKLGLAALYVKDDGRNPSASFKDRASAVGILKALELGRQVIAAASTGNAASSLATLSASVGIRNVIFVPAAAPQAKIAQLLIYGAQVLAVQGTYDQAFELCLVAAREFDWYSRNTAYNPYLSEGKKTAALEICEQLGWQAPDRIFVGVGDGCIIGGLWKGLRDLLALGLIDRMPKLMGVQAEGSQAMVKAWREGIPPEEMIPQPAETIADSIAAGLPRDRVKAMRAVRETGGAYIAVSDDEILAAMKELARGAGVFAEPAGSAPYAGLVKARQQGLVGDDERVVVIATGNGLKDVASAMKATGEPHLIEPTLANLKRLLARLSSQ